jgi:hypothetical protein
MLSIDLFHYSNQIYFLLLGSGIGAVKLKKSDFTLKSFLWVYISNGTHIRLLLTSKNTRLLLKKPALFLMILGRLLFLTQTMARTNIEKLLWKSVEK